MLLNLAIFDIAFILNSTSLITLKNEICFDFFLLFSV